MAMNRHNLYFLSVWLMLSLIMTAAEAGYAAETKAQSNVCLSSGICGETMTWTLNHDGTLTISGKGNMADYHAASQPWHDERRLIRRVVVEEGVTRIGGLAFEDCENLLDLSIPQSVASIGTDAFWGCDSLTGLTIPEGVTAIDMLAFENCENLTEINVKSGNGTFSSADGVLFNKDMTELVAYPNGKKGAYLVPDGVVSIREHAFSSCLNLESIAMPAGMISIGEWAFSGCLGLKSADLPDSITSIGYDAFSYCRSLKNFIIPDGVTSISMEMLCWCDSLTSVTIPDGVTSIAHEGFGYCKNLQDITLPDSIREIENSAFIGCAALRRVNIPDGVAAIEFNTFRDCGSLAEMTIPASVAVIDDWAFDGCENLKKVYYAGESEQWKKISIGKSNDPLINAEVIFRQNVPDVRSADGAERDHIKNHIAVQILQDSDWKYAEQSLLYSYENGMMADGILMFCPVTDYLEAHPAPQITAGSEPFFRMIFDSYVEIFSSRVTYFDDSNGGLTLMEDDRNEPMQFSQLPEGRYLMMIQVNASHGNDDYCCLSLAWVIKR